MYLVWNCPAFCSLEAYPLLVAYDQGIRAVLTLAPVRATAAPPGLCLHALIGRMHAQYLPLGKVYTNGLIEVVVSLPTDDDLKACKRPAARAPKAVWWLRICATGQVLLRLWCNSSGASHNEVCIARRRLTPLPQ